MIAIIGIEIFDTIDILMKKFYLWFFLFFIF